MKSLVADHLQRANIPYSIACHNTVVLPYCHRSLVNHPHTTSNRLLQECPRACGCCPSQNSMPILLRRLIMSSCTECFVPRSANTFWTCDRCQLNSTVLSRTCRCTHNVVVGMCRTLLAPRRVMMPFRCGRLCADSQTSLSSKVHCDARRTSGPIAVLYLELEYTLWLV